MNDLEHYDMALDSKQFRCVFMRVSLPDSPHKVDCGIINFCDMYSNGNTMDLLHEER